MFSLSGHFCSFLDSVLLWYHKGRTEWCEGMDKRAENGHLDYNNLVTQPQFVPLNLVLTMSIRYTQGVPVKDAVGGLYRMTKALQAACDINRELS